MSTPTLNPPPISTPIGAAQMSIIWARWFQLLQKIITGALHPTAPDGMSQTGTVYQGSGVPDNGDGNDGDVYFRTDTPGAVNQRIYVRSAGAWTGIL